MTETPWYLEDGELMNLTHPDTYDIPMAEERRSIVPGQIVQLVFMNDEGCDRMWVVVTIAADGRYVGYVDNHPTTDGLPDADEVVAFEPRHIIDIYPLTTADGPCAICGVQHDGGHH